MDQRIVGVVMVVGALTACSAAPAASERRSTPAPVGVAVEVTSTLPVPESFPPGATVVPLEDMSVLTPEMVPELVTPLPTPVRVVGTIEYVYERTDDAIEAPSEVRAGEPFTVTVYTHRAGCDSPGDPVADTETTIAGNEATITAYDYQTEGVACAAWGGRFPHTATLQFMQPGESVIRLTGMRVGPEDSVPGTPTTLERRIHVR